MLTGLLIMAAAALQQPANGADTIVVTGDARLTEAAARSAIQAVSPVSFQFARYTDPVCPMALGLPSENAKIIEQRIRKIATAAGVLVAPNQCDANLIVILATDKQATFAEIKSKRAYWLTGLTANAIGRLRRERGPVLAWSSITVRNENGQTLSPVQQVNPDVMRVQSASIMMQPTRQQIDGSVIIIDSDAAVGKTVGQLANYAAMRGLAQTRTPAGSGSVNTILSLFDNPSPPKALTGFDLGYLKALYASNGRETAARERNRMARLIASNAN